MENDGGRDSTAYRLVICGVQTPDSSWGVTHPATFVLLGAFRAICLRRSCFFPVLSHCELTIGGSGAVIGLHYYNNYYDTERPSDGGSDVQDGRTAEELEKEIAEVRRRSLEEAERRRQALKEAK